MITRCLASVLLAASAWALDLRSATIVAGPADRKVAQMLTEEIEKRTRIRLPVAERPVFDQYSDEFVKERFRPLPAVPSPPR